MSAHRPGLYRASGDVPGARRVAAASAKRDAIHAIYRAVEAPGWAAANLDALADVLGDLSWLPRGPVILRWPRPSGPDAEAIVDVVSRVAAGSGGSDHPLTVYLE